MPPMIHGVNPRLKASPRPSPRDQHQAIAARRNADLRELLNLGDDDIEEMREEIPPSWREIAWQTLEDPTYSLVSQVWILLIMFCTALSTILYCAETEFKHNVPEEELDMFDWWFWSDLIMVIIFSVDLAARFTVCPNHAAFMRSPMNWIDLLSVVPSWVEWALIAALGVGTSRRFDLRVLRVLRLIKIFRVLKFGRYSKGMQTFVMALTKSSEPLIILFFLLAIAMVVFASLIHLVECARACARARAMSPSRAREVAHCTAQPPSVHSPTPTPRRRWHAGGNLGIHASSRHLRRSLAPSGGHS